MPLAAPGRGASSHNIHRTSLEGLCTVIGARMSHWKWRETKQYPSRARSGHHISCSFVSLHFLCDILAPITVLILRSELWWKTWRDHFCWLLIDGVRGTARRGGSNVEALNEIGIRNARSEVVHRDRCLCFDGGRVVVVHLSSCAALPERASVLQSAG